jgi:hypothetical protein
MRRLRRLELAGAAAESATSASASAAQAQGWFTFGRASAAPTGLRRPLGDIGTHHTGPAASRTPSGDPERACHWFVRRMGT